MIKVLIVDDSMLVRKALTRILSSDPEIEVVGAAEDPYVAREKIKVLKPDVITLDVAMPRMDGITFLRNLMRLNPMPVVMVSSLTGHGAVETLDALELGAVDYVTKPTSGDSEVLSRYREELLHKVKSAARANTGNLGLFSRQAELTADAAASRPASTPLTNPADILRRARLKNKIIAIGASTGGTEAIRAVIEQLPQGLPPIVISQHIPESFSAPFATRLNHHSAIEVKQAEEGDLILPGYAYLAPGDDHLIIARENGHLRCRLSKSAPVNRHRPSVDVMFDSVAKVMGNNAIGVILTGMGNDGAKGLKNLLDSGAKTIAQDEKSSVVWGMPGEAVKLGAAQHVIGLNNIPAKIMALLDQEL